MRQLKLCLITQSRKTQIWAHLKQPQQNTFLTGFHNCFHGEWTARMLYFKTTCIPCGEVYFAMARCPFYFFKPMLWF